MRNIIKIMLLAILVMMLSSCATHGALTFDQIRNLKRGDSRQYVHGILKVEPSYTEYVQYDESKYIVEFTSMETGGKTIPIPIIIPPFIGIFTYNQECKENYAYVYKEYAEGEYKLYDWGFIPDLNKSDCEITRQVVVTAEENKIKKTKKGSK